MLKLKAMCMKFLVVLLAVKTWFIPISRVKKQVITIMFHFYYCLGDFQIEYSTCPNISLFVRDPVLYRNSISSTVTVKVQSRFSHVNSNYNHIRRARCSTINLYQLFFYATSRSFALYTFVQFFSNILKKSMFLYVIFVFFSLISILQPGVNVLAFYPGVNASVVEVFVRRTEYSRVEASTTEINFMSCRVSSFTTTGKTRILFYLLDLSQIVWVLTLPELSFSSLPLLK